MTEPATKKAHVQSERDRFVGMFDQLKEDILGELRTPTYRMPNEAFEWFSKCLDYTVQGGKMNRGLAVVDSYRSLVGERELSETELERCYVLGWCVEWLQAFFLVADDIMDGSQTRRGMPCWYKLEHVGTIAINDAFLLESCIYKLLRKYFRQEKYYVDLLELMHEVTYQTELGQLVDLITAPENNVDLSRFSMTKYRWIVEFKTAYYSFYLPVAMALLMAGHAAGSASFETSQRILLVMGEYFQIQDDYLDCFGDPAVIGKIGTDIQDNKCSWLVNKALEIATPAQRAVLEESYGRKEESHIARIKELYNELDLKTIFERYEEETYASLTKLIDGVDPAVVPHGVFTKFLNKIFKRNK